MNAGSIESESGDERSEEQRLWLATAGDWWWRLQRRR